MTLMLIYFSVYFSCRMVWEITEINSCCYMWIHWFWMYGTNDIYELSSFLEMVDRGGIGEDKALLSLPDDSKGIPGILICRFQSWIYWPFILKYILIVLALQIKWLQTTLYLFLHNGFMLNRWMLSRWLLGHQGYVISLV